MGKKGAEVHSGRLYFAGLAQAGNYEEAAKRCERRSKEKF